MRIKFITFYISAIFVFFYICDRWKIIDEFTRKKTVSKIKYFLCKINEEPVTRVKQPVRIKLEFLTKAFIFDIYFVSI